MKAKKVYAVKAKKIAKEEAIKPVVEYLRSLYSVEELSKILGIHKRTIYRWIKEKKINVIKIGREYKITKEEIEKIVKEGIK
jgi:excisionase family DNA binding protein